MKNDIESYKNEGIHFEHLNDLTNQRQKIDSLGKYSLGLAIASFVVALIFMTIIVVFENGKIPDKEYQPDDLRVLSDCFANGISFTAQVVLFFMGFLIVATLSVAGFIAGMISLQKTEPKISYMLLAANALSPILMIAFMSVFVLVWRME